MPYVPKRNSAAKPNVSGWITYLYCSLMENVDPLLVFSVFASPSPLNAAAGYASFRRLSENGKYFTIDSTFSIREQYKYVIHPDTFGFAAEFLLGT